MQPEPVTSTSCYEAGEPPLPVKGVPGSVPHQTGRQLGGGSSAPTAVGPAPLVSPAGQAAGSMLQPGTARDLIHLAKEASDQLLGSSNAVPKALQILNSIGKRYFLHVSDQAAVGVGCGLDRAAEVVPVLCVPGSSWPNPPQPPPPFHIRRLAHERCYVLWVDPHQPWSAVARGWEKVMWALYWPNGQLVLGLPAAGSSGLLPCRPTPGLVHQPTYPTQQPACQQHNSRAQLAHEAQPVVDGAPGAADPHPSGPGQPGGPAPLPAQQACPAPGRAPGGAGLVMGTKVAPPTSLPDTGGTTQSPQVDVRLLMSQAKQAQQQLLLSPGAIRHQRLVSLDRSQYLLKFMAQPAQQRPLNKDEHEMAMQAVVCVTHDGQPTVQQLPPPLLLTRRSDREWKLIWKEPKWPWSSLMQHWEEVKWTATSPQGQWVLGLKAAGNARPATVSLGSQLNSAAPAAAPLPPPSRQQQGAGVQQASMARQPAPAAPEAPTLPAAAPALPIGPEPHLGHAPCPGALHGAGAMLPAPKSDAPSLPPHPELPGASTHDLAAMQEELVGHPAMPGIQSVSTQWRDATVMATARPEAQPLPPIDSWTQLKGFTDRTLEYLPKPLALQFGLDECGADKVELLVVLAHPSGSTGADQGPGSLQLPYEATRRPEGRWSLKARPPQSMRISTWVKGHSLSLTGRCKAQRAEQGQAKEQLLVLEVRPLNEAAASVGHATSGVPANILDTSGAGGRLLVADAMATPIQALGSGAVLPITLTAAGPAAYPSPPLRNMVTQGQQQPCAQQVAAYGHVAADVTKTTTPPDGASYPLCDPQPEPEHRAVSGEEGSLGPGFRTGMKRKAADADADADQSPEAGEAAAAASVKRHLGCGPHEPDLVDGVAQPAPDQDPEEMEVAPAALPESPAPAVADTQPHTDSWTQLKGFTDRSLEYLPKPMALQFGLHESGADKVELLVVLAHQSGSTGADHGPGCLQLPYEATRRPDGRWSLKARSPQSVKISTWVKNCGLALTGRCKAQRAEPGQAVEQLLVLEVRPLSEAAASAGQATPGTAQGPGALPPAPGAEAQPPELQAELPGEISGTTSADVATADVDEEEGSQPPQPIAAGIPSGSMTSADAATASIAAAAAVALEEEGPHPSHPVATGTPSGGSALRARLAGSGREDAIDLTIEEPDVKPDPGLQSGPMAAKDLVVAVVAMLDKHLPASEVPMLADAYTCMGEWLSSPHGAAQLEALSKVYAATLLKCAGMSSTMVAWTLWKSIQRLLEQTPAQTPSFDAVSNEATLSPAATFDLNHTGSSAQAAAAARQSKSTASELEGPEGPAKRHRGLVPRKLCMGGGEADTASDQDQEAAAQEVVGAEELPPAALTGLPTTRGNLGNRRDDRYHGNHGALLPRQGLHDGPASASPTPLAGQAASPGRQATTRSGPMNCAQHPVQQPLRTACPISSPGLLAASLLMPDCVREVLNKAQQLQDLLLVSRGAANDLAMQHNVDATLLRDLDPDFLPFLSQPARPPNWNIRREGQQVVMVCVPSNGMPTLQRPPPPFLVSCRGNSVWELVWKAPDWPWGSVQQHWGKVEWMGKGPHQELVLGLQAAIRPGHAADNSSTPSSSVVHAAFPTPQQQGPGSQGATMVGRMEAAASKGPPSLALPHAPPCGSEPLPGQHAGNGVKGAAGRSLTASLGGPVPSAVMSPSQAALLAVPGTHGIGNTASPHSQPATPASLYRCPGIIFAWRSHQHSCSPTITTGQGLCYLLSGLFACSKHPVPLRDSLPQPACEGRAIYDGMKHMH